MTRVVISGYYGFDNMGDEAVLSSIVEGLRQILPDIDIVVLSANVAKTGEIHKVKAINRNSIREVARCIKHSDILISGGGSLLQDVTSKRSVFYYLGVILMGLLFRKPVMIFAQGIGPLTSNLSRFLVQLILNRVSIISVRDEESAKLLMELGIKNSLINVTADPVFNLEPPSDEEVDELVSYEGISSNDRWVGISIREWKGLSTYREHLARAADYIIDRYQAKVVLIPMHISDDFKESEIIKNMMKNEVKIIKGKYTPREIMGLIKKLDIVIGMRLHALIFSARMGIPFIGISYDPKVDSLIKLMGQSELNKKNIIEQIDELFENPCKYSCSIKERANNLQIKAKFSNKLFLDVIGKGANSFGRENKDS